LSWGILALAGACEVAWAVGMKYAQGFTRPVPSAVTVFFMILSVVLLEIAEKRIPVGTAYAVWTGIGAVGVAVCGMLLFGEPRTPARALCIGLIVTGIVGLKAVTK
jgi:quaternary ammonium compound-resistance protein SugE